MLTLFCWITSALLHLIAPYPFQGHERVLHLGCAAGAISADIATNLPDGLVLGLDTSVTRAQLAYDFPNLDFKTLDSLDSLHQFDLAIATSTDHLQALAQALKPGGQLLLALPAPSPLFNRVPGLDTSDPSPLLVAAGFTVDQLTIVPCQESFTSQKRYEDWIASWLSPKSLKTLADIAQSPPEYSLYIVRAHT